MDEFKRLRMFSQQQIDQYSDMDQDLRDLLAAYDMMLVRRSEWNALKAENERLKAENAELRAFIQQSARMLEAINRAVVYELWSGDYVDRLIARMRRKIAKR